MLVLNLQCWNLGRLLLKHNYTWKNLETQTTKRFHNYRCFFFFFFVYTRCLISHKYNFSLTPWWKTFTCQSICSVGKRSNINFLKYALLCLSILSPVVRLKHALILIPWGKPVWRKQWMSRFQYSWFRCVTYFVVMQLKHIYFSAHLNTTCPQDYKYHSDMNLCWKFEKGAKLNYFESHERCSKQGAHLMVVYTKGVLRFMQEWLASGMIQYRNLCHVE